MLIQHIGPGLLTPGVRSFLQGLNSLQGEKSFLQDPFCKGKNESVPGGDSQLGSVPCQVWLQELHARSLPEFHLNAAKCRPEWDPSIRKHRANENKMPSRPQEVEALGKISPHQDITDLKEANDTPETPRALGSRDQEKAGAETSEILRAPWLLTQCPVGLPGFKSSRAVNGNIYWFWTLRWGQSKDYVCIISLLLL